MGFDLQPVEFSTHILGQGWSFVVTVTDFGYDHSLLNNIWGAPWPIFRARMIESLPPWPKLEARTICLPSSKAHVFFFTVCGNFAWLTFFFITGQTLS